MASWHQMNDVPFFDQPSEEILIFARPELRVERWRSFAEKVSLQQHVAGPTLSPVDHESRRVAWPIVELAFHDPLRRLILKVRFHRSEDAVNPILISAPRRGSAASS